MFKKHIFISILLLPLFCWAGDKPIYYANSDTTSPISKAVQVGNTYYLSGQLGLITDIKSKERRLIDGGISKQTEQSIKNIETVLDELGLTLKDVVKVTVIVKNIDEMPEFNKIYEKHFSQKPARMAFEASAIAYDAEVEIEVVAINSNKQNGFVDFFYNFI